MQRKCCPLGIDSVARQVGLHHITRLPSNQKYFPDLTAKEAKGNTPVIAIDCSCVAAFWIVGLFMILETKQYSRMKFFFIIRTYGDHYSHVVIWEASTEHDSKTTTWASWLIYMSCLQLFPKVLKSIIFHWYQTTKKLLNLPNGWSKNQHLTGCGVFSDPTTC